MPLSIHTYIFANKTNSQVHEIPYDAIVLDTTIDPASGYLTVYITHSDEKAPARTFIIRNALYDEYIPNHYKLFAAYREWSVWEILEK